MKYWFRRLMRPLYNIKATRNVEILNSRANELAGELNLNIIVKAYIELDNAGQLLMNSSISTTYSLPSRGFGDVSSSRKKPVKIRSNNFSLTITDAAGSCIMNCTITNATNIDESKNQIYSALYAAKMKDDLTSHFSKMMTHLESSWPEVMADLVLNEFVPDKEVYTDEK